MRPGYDCLSTVHASDCLLTVMLWHWIWSLHQRYHERAEHLIPGLTWRMTFFDCEKNPFAGGAFFNEVAGPHTSCLLFNSKPKPK